MDFGYINIEDVEVKVKVENETKTAKIPLMKSIDGFTILKLCPLSMGGFSNEKLMNLTEKQETEIRKTEHQIMKDIVKNYFPPDWEIILDRLPYFDFLSLLDVLLLGEKLRTEEEVIKDFGVNSPQYILWKATHPEIEEKKKKKK